MSECKCCCHDALKFSSIFQFLMIWRWIRVHICKPTWTIRARFARRFSVSRAFIRPSTLFTTWSSMCPTAWLPSRSGTMLSALKVSVSGLRWLRNWHGNPLGSASSIRNPLKISKSHNLIHSTTNTHLFLETTTLSQKI